MSERWRGLHNPEHHKPTLPNQQPSGYRPTEAAS
jgi:hypothetical protein